MADLKSEVQKAKALLKSQGYVVLTEKSYKAAQKRHGSREMQLHWARQDAKSAESWARDCLKEERRLHNRLTEIIHLATKHGMTTEDLVSFNDQLDKKGPKSE